jgi:hypothetical protein
MERKLLIRGLSVLVAAAFSALVGAQTIDSFSSNHLPISVRVPRGMAGHVNPAALAEKANTLSAAARQGGLNIYTQSFPPGSIFVGNTLPLWTFNIKGSRDGDHHLGVMVGRDPFRNPGTARVPTFVVPLIIRTHTVAASFDPTTFKLATTPGETTVDSTQVDDKCLAAPNNVPLRVFLQSPIFNAPPKPFVFNGVQVGATQYVDAFQRANFSSVLGGNGDDYHVLLAPVITLPPVVIDVPATAGIALTNPDLFKAALGFSICAPVMLVDINWFDSFLNGTVIHELEEQGVNPGTFPIYMSYNTFWPVGDVTDLGNCCAGGYHSITGVPLETQTYGVVNFDTSGLFAPSKNAGTGPGLNTETASHEVAEWMNDPYTNNQTAPWGGIGQVANCQANLEVGDPLSGTDVTAVTMPNGFNYNLQELAFFSWFYGGPSIGAGGVFSNNGTFKTDAGPNCPANNLSH